MKKFVFKILKLIEVQWKLSANAYLKYQLRTSLKSMNANKPHNEFPQNINSLIVYLF